MQDLMSFVVSSEFGSWVAALSGVVAAATALTALTPTRWDDRALNVVSRILNILAGNIGKNRNADDV